MTDIKIKPLHVSDIPFLAPFPPTDWHFDIVSFMNLHFNKPYFYAVVATLNEIIVGTGNVFINGTESWLGNIIVKPELRRQGVGTEITKHLQTHSINMGCETQLLIATELGEPLYNKLGFAVDSYYLFYEGRKLGHQSFSAIRQINQDDHAGVFHLDKRISGENRKSLLSVFIKDGFVFEVSNVISGYYLPGFGNGLIIAKSSKPGLALLQFKHTRHNTSAIIPDQNNAAREFIQTHGFSFTKKVTRMYSGKKLNWKPECVFSRAAGYCG